MFPVHHLIAGLIIGLILLSIISSAAVFLVIFIRHRRRRSLTEGDAMFDPEKGSTTPTPKVAADKEVDGCKKKNQEGEGGIRMFSWKEIEEMTGGFDPSAVIGEGGFSTVYLARFKNGSQRRCAAVKVQRLQREFRHELDVLRGVRHKGVVRLLGYCDERDSGALVFDHIPDGTLQDRLHNTTGTPPTTDNSAAPAPLPWPHRTSIAHQLASALQYLHESCDPHVIHADVKPANILLDLSEAKSVLCDFGSARTGFSSAVAVESGRRRGEQMVASPGYVDPHLLRTGVASRKSDVYSYGMVLMELVTGKEAVGVDKREVARAVEGGKVRDVVDGRLGEGEYDVSEAAALAALAVRCVGEQPSLRPSMGEVTKVLEDQVGCDGGGRDEEKEQQVVMEVNLPNLLVMSTEQDQTAGSTVPART